MTSELPLEVPPEGDEQPVSASAVATRDATSAFAGVNLDMGRGPFSGGAGFSCGAVGLWGLLDARVADGIDDFACERDEEHEDREGRDERGGHEAGPVGGSRRG